MNVSAPAKETGSTEMDTIADLQTKFFEAVKSHGPRRAISHKMKLLRALQLESEMYATEKWEYWATKKALDLKADASDLVFYAQRATWDERDSKTLAQALAEADEALSEAKRAIADMREHVDPMMTAAE